MSLITYQIESRLRQPHVSLYGELEPPHRWNSLPSLRPETMDEAAKLCETLHRAMPMKDFRVTEIHDEDIPF